MVEKRRGQRRKGEAILELETDKVNVEVVSEEAGVLSEQLASEGDTVEVGQAIAVIGEGSGNASKENSNDNTPQQNDETTNNKKKKQQINRQIKLKSIKQMMTISSVLMLHLLRVVMLVKTE